MSKNKGEIGKINSQSCYSYRFKPTTDFYFIKNYKVDLGK